MAATDDVDDLASNFRQLCVDKDDINVLLLGETGIGKSTFINSFTNYLHYSSLDLAQKSELKCLIPAKFEITIDENETLKTYTISIGKDTNENTTIFNAATQGVRSYTFPIPDFNNKVVRLIDTPGICDDRGIEQDKTNLENILSYLGRIETLHGICILLKPNNCRLTPAFEYCITQLLSRLEKSAGDIITFVFTNSRGCSYKPQGSSAPINALLTKIAQNPPYVTIKYEMVNIFCLDNESFRYLAALKQGHDTGDRALMKESWDKSTAECHRLIKYLTGEGPQKPTPHQVSRTISVNKARQVILELSKPLADITELINDNLTVLRNHQENLKQDTKSIEELNDKLYVPVVDLEQIECPQPKTVCHNNKCCEQYSVGDLTKLHYKQRCHDPCYLTNVTRELIGDTGLKHCAAMDGSGKCKHCDCDFSAHVHIYYETRTVNGRIEGAGIRTQINDTTSAMIAKKDMIRRVEQEKNEYENEKNIIIKAMAKFAHFLERNAISPFNDSYKNYIKILIERENSRPECNLQQIKSLKSMLNQYDEEKKILQDVLKVRVIGNLNHDEITPDLVLKEIRSLYSLKKMGMKIRNMHEMQIKGEAVEHKNTEFVLPHSQNLGFNVSKNNSQHTKGRGNNKVNKINEDSKFKGNKKGAHEKQYFRDKMQNMGRNYQNQQNQPNQNRNQNHQQRNPQKKFQNNPNNGGYKKYNQNNFPNQLNNTQIPPLMNQVPTNYYQGPSMNYQMPPPQFNVPPQFQYPNMHPNTYQQNQWYHPPNQQPPQNLYPNYQMHGYPPQNLQQHNQNIPINNAGNSSSQQKIKDPMKDNDSLYEELYATDKKSTKDYGNNYRGNKKKLNNEDSDSDNEVAAGYEKFRNQKGNENYKDLYGDDDDDDDDHGRGSNRFSGYFNGIKNMFK